MHFLLSLSHLFFALLALACPVIAVALLSRRIDVASARRLRQVDRINGIAATLVLLIGLARLFCYGKGVEYYLHNGPFIAKLVLYALASGLSLLPTLEFKRWAAPLKAGTAPVIKEDRLLHLRRLLACQAVCVLGMMGCAMLAGKGVGSFG